MSTSDVPAPIDPTPIDTRTLAAEIEAEVRARRAAGEYPPGFERELDVLFDRFAPPEVSNDFDAALERSEDLVVMDPVIPVASRNPALGIVKRLVSKLIGWYHGWIAQQISAMATAMNTALRLLGERVKGLERVTGEVARAREVAGRAPAPRDDAAWAAQVGDALRGCTGRIALVQCGNGDLLAALVDAELDAYGVEPRGESADAARRRGLEVRHDDGLAHLNAVGDGALSGIVLRGLVERSPIGDALELVETASTRLAPEGRLVICSLTREAWGEGSTAVESDLVPGHPLHPETWAHILAEHEFTDVLVQPAGTGAYIVQASRARA
jgi:SAM-dependent methyltransferase